jgi:protein-arginine kinase activator protein McsA
MAMDQDYKICPVCKKRFYVPVAEMWVLHIIDKRGRKRFVCKESCSLKYNRERDKGKISIEQTMELVGEILENMTQKELAAILGVGQESVYKWANGYSKPSRKNIERLTKLNFT